MFHSQYLLPFRSISQPKATFSPLNCTFRIFYLVILMKVPTQTSTYLYLQPIYATLYTLNPADLCNSVYQIQAIKEVPLSYESRRNKIKIRDVMTVGRQYQVYGNQLHFYNAVYEISIKNEVLDNMKQQTVTLQLKSRQAENYHTRRYEASIGQLLARTSQNQNLAHQITLECSDYESKLLCNVLFSHSPCSLLSLQQILVQQEDLRQPQSSKLLRSDFYQTNASSIMTPTGREKFERTTKSVKTVSGGKFIRRTKRKLLSIQSRESTNLLLTSKRIEAQQCSSARQSTSSYRSQSSQNKRISRLRRSIMIPHKEEIQVEEKELHQTVSQYRKSLGNGLYNLTVLIGVVMIFVMMSPARRV